MTTTKLEEQEASEEQRYEALKHARKNLREAMDAFLRGEASPEQKLALNAALANGRLDLLPKAERKAMLRQVAEELESLDEEKPQRPKKSREEIRKAKDQALLKTALEVHFCDAVDAKSMGFLGRAFVMATLPHKKVQGTEFIRKNGDYTLSVLAPSETGIPYGVIPRLILIWISEEVVKKKSRELILGESLSAWMAELGMMPTGGRWGSITRLKQQMKALLASSITATWGGAGAWALKRVSVADDAILWWDPKNPDQTTLWESKLILTEKLFQELMEHSVPFDKRILKHLKRSPLALDLYIWLTYRFHYLKQRQAIPWGSLMRQFGSGYEATPKGVAHFKTEFKKQLQKVLKLYQTARVEVSEGELVLHPSPTSIDPQIITNTCDHA